MMHNAGIVMYADAPSALSVTYMYRVCVAGIREGSSFIVSMVFSLSYVSVLLPTVTMHHEVHVHVHAIYRIHR